MKIFHISDLHIRSDMKHNFNVESKLYSLQNKLDVGNFVICTGDITDDGSSIQYTNALKLLTPFRNRIFLVPGNHDYGPAGNFYDRKCATRFMELKEAIGYPSLEFYGLRILEIDSNLRTKNPFDLARGDVGWWDRRKIRNFGLRCKKDKKTSLVCLHHTPFEEHWALEMKDPESFLRACEGYVDYVLVGHEHKKRIISFNRSGTQQGTVYYSAPSLADKDAEAQPLEINIQLT